MSVLTISTAPNQTSAVDSRHLIGEEAWRVRYLDPATGELREMHMLPRLGSCPKRTLEAMGVPFDFGVEVTFDHIR